MTQIKESPFGKELGFYSVSSYIPVALSEQFWIRFKTNGQRSARGFKLHWSRKLFTKSINNTKFVHIDC